MPDCIEFLVIIVGSAEIVKYSAKVSEILQRHNSFLVVIAFFVACQKQQSYNKGHHFCRYNRKPDPVDVQNQRQQQNRGDLEQAGTQKSAVKKAEPKIATPANRKEKE